MLMFAKVALNSFIWDVIDIFCFGDNTTIDI